VYNLKFHLIDTKIDAMMRSTSIEWNVATHNLQELSDKF